MAGPCVHACRILRLEEPAWHEDVDEDDEDEDDGAGEGYIRRSKSSSFPLLPLKTPRSSRANTQLGDKAVLSRGEMQQKQELGAAAGPAPAEEVSKLEGDEEDQQLLARGAELSSSDAAAAPDTSGSLPKAGMCGPTQSDTLPEELNLSRAQSSASSSSFLQRISSFRQGSRGLTRSNSIALRTQFLLRLGSRNFIRTDTPVFVHVPSSKSLTSDEATGTGDVKTAEAGPLQELSMSTRLTSQLEADEGDADVEEARQETDATIDVAQPVCAKHGKADDGILAAFDKAPAAYDEQDVSHNSSPLAGSKDDSGGGGTGDDESERAARTAQNKQVALTIAAYGFVSLLYCALDELLPLFASAPSDQGAWSVLLYDVQVCAQLVAGCDLGSFPTYL